MGLITVLLAAIFQGPARQSSAGTLNFYNTLLRLFCCFTLFSAGMILKTLAAKMMSSHFNKSSYFDKMQDALRKVGTRAPTVSSCDVVQPQTGRMRPLYLTSPSNVRFTALFTPTQKSEIHMCHGR